MFNHLGFARGVGLNVRTHVLVDNNHTVCTANTKDKKTMEPEDGLDWKDVDCKKCMRSAFYKEAIQNLDPPEKSKKKSGKKQVIDKIIKTNEKIDNVKNPVQETKPEEVISEEPKQEEVKSKESENVQDEITDDISPNTDVECKVDEKLEEKVVGKVRELNTFISEIIHSVRGQFYCIERADLKYRIIHEPSGKAMFDKVGQDLIIQALVSLNWIKTQWDGKHIMPKTFITEMRRAMKYAFLISGQNYPKCLDDKLKEHKHMPNKRQKVVIKRRTKPQVEVVKSVEQKVVIKRRSKSTIKIPHRSK
ncbi:MAG: hypothetical protein ACE5RH_00570 [Nitrosarchaeum sp.]